MKLRSCSMPQDHRRIKRLVKPGLGFNAFNTARRTLKGYEAMAMIRKGQIKNIDGKDVTGQISFIGFEVSASMTLP